MRALQTTIPELGGISRPVWITALGLALGVGALAALWPGPTLGALLLPFVLALSVRFPEALLILFLTAGLYKEDPRIAAALDRKSVV